MRVVLAHLLISLRGLVFLLLEKIRDTCTDKNFYLVNIYYVSLKDGVSDTDVLAALSGGNIKVSRIKKTLRRWEANTCTSYSSLDCKTACVPLSGQQKARRE